MQCFTLATVGVIPTWHEVCGDVEDMQLSGGGGKEGGKEGGGAPVFWV